MRSCPDPEPRDSLEPRGSTQTSEVAIRSIAPAVDRLHNNASKQTTNSALTKSQSRKPRKPRKTRARQQTARALLAYSVRIVPEPSSVDSVIALRLEAAIKATETEYTWIRLGPSLIGRDKTFDIAALAYSQAGEYYMQQCAGFGDQALLQAALDNYDIAVSRLRLSLTHPSESVTSLDMAAATSAALASAEGWIFPGGKYPVMDDRATFIHYDALSKYMIADAEAGRGSPSIPFRALFYDIAKYRYLRTCLFGTWDGSPTFPKQHQAYWDQMEPYSIEKSSEPWERLQSLNQKSDLWMFDLIQLGKALQNGEGHESTRFIALAQRLLNLQDELIENKILSRVTFVKTSNGAGRAVPLIPYSFAFDSPRWPVIIHYWTNLLMVLHISLRANELLRKHQRLVWLNEEQVPILERIQKRMANNVLMGKQYAFRRSIYSRLQLLHPLLVVWATCSDGNQIAPSVSAGDVRNSILHDLQGLAPPFTTTWTHMDLVRIADLFGMGTPITTVGT